MLYFLSLWEFIFALANFMTEAVYDFVTLNNIALIRVPRHWTRISACLSQSCNIMPFG
jgi:hypothetical protein